MSHAYWSQWSASELADMQGVLPDDHNDDQDDDLCDDQNDQPKIRRTDISYDLGISWRDFI